MIIFLSLKCSTAYFSMELLIGCLKTFPLEIGEGPIGKSTYAMGVGSVACVRVYKGGRSVKFLSVWCVGTD